MLLWVLLAGFVMGASSWADNVEVSFALGKDYQSEMITLKAEAVNKKKVYSLSYASPKRGAFNRPVSKDAYDEIYKQALQWEKDIIKNRHVANFTDCSHPIRVTMGKKHKPLCLNALSKKERKKFYQWFNEQAHSSMIQIEKNTDN